MDKIIELYWKFRLWLDSLIPDSNYSTKRSNLTSMLREVSSLETCFGDTLRSYGIITKTQRAHFWAQLIHESGLRLVRENMNYSASRLLQIFPRHFNTQTALQYSRKPVKIANKVYANRMGNGPESSGDGWKFRGGGYLQHTGRNEYATLDKIVKGVSINPDLLLEKKVSLECALSYWERLDLISLANSPHNLRRITRKINGGTNGIADRQKWFDLLIKNLK
jgi:putative chitinase